jgi:very-short-patch-repair endonuclease
MRPVGGDICIRSGDLPNGEVVVLEIDGGHHLEVTHWEADMKRERAVVITRRWVLRATVFEIRLEAASVFSDLRAMGVPTLADQILKGL